MKRSFADYRRAAAAPTTVRVILGTVVVGIFAVVLTVVWRIVFPRKPNQITSIARNEGIWSPQAESLLSNLSGWTEIGEQSVTMFSNELLGDTTYPTLAEAMRRKIKFDELVSKSVARPRWIAFLLRNVFRSRFQAPNALVGAQDLSVLAIDDGFQLVTKTPALELLAPRLTIKVLRRRIGEPDKTASVNSVSDEGPLSSYTVYSYANETYQFIELTNAPPVDDDGTRLIDRVVVRVSQLRRALAR